MLGDSLILMAVAGPAAVVPLVTAGPLAACSESELIERAAGGDPLAQQALYVRYAPAMAQRVGRLLGRSADAEDVVQDAFVEAFRDLEKLQDRSRLGQWLMRVAIHQTYRVFRKRRLLRRLGLDRGADDYALSRIADDRVDAELITKLGELDRVLSRMPTNWRIVWMLRHIEGCSLPEVAEQTGASLSSVKRYLARGESMLHSEIDWEWEAEPGT